VKTRRTILTNVLLFRYGLAWNIKKEGLLLSGSDDNLVCLWDINAVTSTNSTLAALQIFKHHTNVVEDVAWNPHHVNYFGTVSDDKHLIM
jgi:histone-binding protein RBBP4